METIIAVADAALASRFQGLLLAIATIVGLLIIRHFATRAVRAYVYTHAYKRDNADRFMATWKYAWTAVIAILGLISLSGSRKTLGVSAGFLGMILGWSLQAPITGIAAWVMLISIRPYRVGDRVIMEGKVGDVKDICVAHTQLDQVGGTIVGEEKSGRALLVPNMHLFGWTIVNYTRDEPFILDEAPVRVTYDSNLGRAERILVEQARDVLGQLVDETGLDPYVRHEFIRSGIVSRVRYKVPPKRRQEISSKIVQSIFRAVNPEPDVRLCHVQRVTDLAPRDDAEPLPPQHPHQHAAQQPT